MPPRSIGFFKSILESYEDVGIFSVLDGEKGLIEIIYSSSFEEEIEGIISDLGKNGVKFREVPGV